MPPANRIGIYYAPPNEEELQHARKLDQQVAELCEANFTEGWNLGSGFGYSEGYATGWVHAAALFLAVSVAVAVLRNW